MGQGGRPRKSLALKALDGDTKKIGAKKFEAALAQGVSFGRGRPRMPKFLREPEDGEDTRTDVERMAADYWEEVADGLAAEGFICYVDGGMLTNLALVYAQMVEAGRSGARNFVDLSQRYMQAADRMGLNESARAKFTKAPTKENEPELDAMSDFLGESSGDNAQVC